MKIINILKTMNTKTRIISIFSAIAAVGIVTVIIITLSDDAPLIENNLSQEKSDEITGTTDPENNTQEPTESTESDVIHELSESPEPLPQILEQLPLPDQIELLEQLQSVPTDDRNTVQETIPSNPIIVEERVIIRFGRYDWRVLEIRDGKALIITDKLTENRAYHNDWTDITWENSDLRAYLNGEFYGSFNEADRRRIAETPVINNDNPWYGTAGGNNTMDRIFLLSIDEVLRYFGDSGSLTDRPAEDNWFISDRYNQNRITRHTDDDYNWDDDHGNWWWLRSPGEEGVRAAYVFDDGILYIDGYYVRRNFLSVRPALWLNLET
jgi:hypothetical protein